MCVCLCLALTVWVHEEQKNIFLGDGIKDSCEPPDGS